MNTNYTDAKNVLKLKYTENFCILTFWQRRPRTEIENLSGQGLTPIIHAKYGDHPLGFATENLGN